ncbi:MAG TPA: S41 family peptidase, partial [Verrucomicrobiae bacterium]|nr:S41 family peptidase [Verrucomicrobiae bacterium]
MTKRATRVVVTSLVIFVLAVNSLLIVLYWTDFIHLGQLTRLTLLVKGKSLNAISLGQMIDGAAAGMVKSLGDPYSTYMKAEDYAKLQDELEGIFGGVGLILDVSEETQLKISGVLKTSPAEKAGLRKGDIITAVNGQSVAKIKALQAAELMKGEVGSEVNLTIAKGTGFKEYKLKREIISLKSVESKALKVPEKIAYFKINSFNDHVVAELNKAWESMEGSQGIILDLRDNPGGGLEEAVQVAGKFVPKGPVVHLIFRSGQRQTYQVEGSNPGVPIIVLVNGGTASAAEILAAAIQETKA